MLIVRGLMAILFLASTAAALDGDASWIGSPTELITLDQAIDMALTNNLDAHFDRAGLHIARDRVRLAWGVFDPVISIGTARESVETPQNATNISSAAEAQQIQLQQQSIIAQQ